MIMFNSDYLEGAHEKIIKKLTETNLVQTIGYGKDEFCSHAKSMIRKELGDENAYIEFLVGGTQTNTTVLDYLLRSHEGVIAASTGHIACHESGAIEATGHKVITLPEHNGKITANQIEAYVLGHLNDESKEHMVKPKVVFIAFSTEEGTLYTKEELKAIYEVCQKYNLYLYLDGARLGYGLTSEKCDLTLQDIYNYTDVFYIGGTKVGALFGEAVVFKSTTPHDEFKYYIKQKGGLLAKGRLLGIQYEGLFEKENGECTYFTIAKHANIMAMKLKQAFLNAGFSLYRDSYTNQQFPILPDKLIKKLKEEYSFNYWCRIDDHQSAVRFCTSWATKEENVDKFISDLNRLK